MWRWVPSLMRAFGGAKTDTIKRWVILVAALVTTACVLACTTSTFISRRERPSATPARTLRPTFTMTPVPGLALIPTNTPAPGDVEQVPNEIPSEPAEPADTISTPVPNTQTPVSPTTGESPPPAGTAPPTATGAPSGVPPVPTASPTEGPSPTATQEMQPSATPGAPSSWTGEISGRGQDCGLTRLLGITHNRNGELAGDIWVHYWADGGDSKWTVSHSSSFGSGPSIGESEANWDGIISPYPLDGLWHVCVVDAPRSSNCLSNAVDVQTSSDCRSGDQVVHITFREN
jgi:hypothetical protein